MSTDYNGLYIRKATEEEANDFTFFWKDRFSGYVAVWPDIGTFVVVNSKENFTPYGTFRINDSHSMLIKSNLCSYDCIWLEDNFAVYEALDCGDKFYFDKE